MKLAIIRCDFVGVCRGAFTVQTHSCKLLTPINIKRTLYACFVFSSFFDFWRDPAIMNRVIPGTVYARFDSFMFFSAHCSANKHSIQLLLTEVIASLASDISTANSTSYTLRLKSELQTIFRRAILLSTVCSLFCCFFIAKNK